MKSAHEVLEKHPDLSAQMYVNEISDHRTYTMTVHEVYNALSETLLCPVLSGDLPYQHRFYDSMAAGCLPVVAIRKAPSDCVSYYNSGNRWMSSDEGCRDRVLPFRNCQLDWSRIMVEIPHSGNMVEKLQELDKAVLLDKRRYLLRHRHKLVYDMTGTTYDAFTATLVDLMDIIARENGTASTSSSFGKNIFSHADPKTLYTYHDFRGPKGLGAWCSV